MKRVFIHTARLFSLLRCFITGSSTRPQSYSIRVARVEDVPFIRRCNLENLPENYSDQFYQTQLVSWPELSLVCCDDSTDDLMGYCLGRVEVDVEKSKLQGKVYAGHVASLAVFKQHRGRDVAHNLMETLHRKFISVYDVDEVSLYCRVRILCSPSGLPSVFGPTGLKYACHQSLLGEASIRMLGYCQ